MLPKLLAGRSGAQVHVLVKKHGIGADTDASISINATLIETIRLNGHSHQNCCINRKMQNKVTGRTCNKYKFVFQPNTWKLLWVLKDNTALMTPEPTPFAAGGCDLQFLFKRLELFTV